MIDVELKILDPRVGRDIPLPTPATPGWATIESDSSLKSFFGDIATGHASPADAAKAFDTHLGQALNAAP